MTERIFTAEDLRKAFRAGAAHAIGSHQLFKQTHPDCSEYIELVLSSVRKDRTVPDRKFITNVTGCARCGGNHVDVEFTPLVNPETSGAMVTHWGTCPKTGEPIMLHTVPTDLDVKELNEYQTRAYACALPASQSCTYMALGLANEAGEVLGKIKKAIRDDGCSIEELSSERREQIAHELGDVLWYVAGLAEHVGYALSRVATMNIDKLEDRKDRGALTGDGDNR